MKLRTVMDACLPRGSVGELERDAMAAHALLQAIDDWHEKNGTGPDEDVYPGAAVGWITRRADEILAGWMGDRG